MDNIQDFWSGLIFILSGLWKLVVVVGLVLFIIIFINIILKKINQSWSQKFVKKLDKIITSANGLKSVVRSFESLINIIFEAFASIIDLFVMFIEIIFITIDKFLFSPLRIFIAYVNIGSRKMEKFKDKLVESDNEEKFSTDKNNVNNAGGSSDELMESMLKANSRNNQDTKKSDDLMSSMLKSKVAKGKGSE